MMAWNYPAYQPYQQQTRGKPAWVQGAEGAKAEYVAPGESGFFLDSETQRFYIKTVDPSGIPGPLRAFRYTEEVVTDQSAAAGGVTREEFDALRQSVEALLKGETKDE